MMSYVTTVTARSAIYIPDLVEVGPRATEYYLLRLTQQCGLNVWDSSLEVRKFTHTAPETAARNAWIRSLELNGLPT